MVVGAVLCDGEGERAYTAYAPFYSIFASRTNVFSCLDGTSNCQDQKFKKFEEHPKSVRIKMANLAGRWNQKGSIHKAKKTPQITKKAEKQ